MNPHTMCSLRRRAGAVLCAVAMAASLVLLGRPTAAEAASPHQLRVITHNIEGGPEFEGSAAALDGVDHEIDRFSPDVVALTEVCESQVRAFRARHPDWDIRFAVMIENQDSCDSDSPGEPNGQRQGQLLASPHPIMDRAEFDLGHPDMDDPNRVKRFSLLCGHIHVPGHSPNGLRACVTHLHAFTRGHHAREQQTKKIRRLLHDDIWVHGKAVTVAGDFNAKPNWNAMDDLYFLNRDSSYTGRGDFHEADQTDRDYFQDHGSVTCRPTVCRSGQSTKDTRKLDYAFISRNVTHKGRVSGMATHSYGSDHKLYRALFNIRF